MALELDIPNVSLIKFTHICNTLIYFNVKHSLVDRKCEKPSNACFWEGGKYASSKQV